MESFRPFVRYARKHEQRIPTAEVCAALWYTQMVGYFDSKLKKKEVRKCRRGL